MTDIRCQCGKILCQREEYVIVIKCRHCKRTIKVELREADKREGRTVAAKPIIFTPKVAINL
jgi:hypothetical protein